MGVYEFSQKTFVIQNHGQVLGIFFLSNLHSQAGSWVDTSKWRSPTFGVSIKSLQICPPKKHFRKLIIRHRWYHPPDLNIGDSRVWRLDSGSTLSPIIMVQWKITLTFPLNHDYGRKGKSTTLNNAAFSCYCRPSRTLLLSTCP